MEKFKHFKYFENDNGLSLNTSTIYSRNYSIDFGSRMGTDKYYQRYIILSRIYKKNMLSLRFFSEENNSSYKSLKNNMLKMYFFLENLSNIKKTDYSANKLKKIILKFFNKKS
jgi:ribosomal protein L28